MYRSVMLLAMLPDAMPRPLRTPPAMTVARQPKRSTHTLHSGPAWTHTHRLGHTHTPVDKEHAPRNNNYTNDTASVVVPATWSMPIITVGTQDTCVLLAPNSLRRSA